MENIMKKDVYELAKENHVIIVAEPLAKIYAYYNKSLGQRFIHINDDLPKDLRKYLIAHMLYFALYTKEGIQLLKEKHSKNFTEAEKAANNFALKLLATKENADKISEFMLKEEMKELSSHLKKLWGTDKIDEVIAQSEQQ